MVNAFGRSCLVVAGVFATVASCRLPFDYPNVRACTLIALPAITMHVRDSVSGAAMARGATATATDGSFVSTSSYPDAFTQDDLPLSLAHEREGTYTVNVVKPGYREWRVAGVQVTRDECHVKTVTLTARLQR